jgi:uracil-DNA glycosylase family 4
LNAGKTAPSLSDISTPEPPHDCGICPRLASFRDEARSDHPDWFNAPVPTFSAGEPRLLIVGLAPGLRGANRTGRPFTGDYAGDLLYETLLACGFAEGIYDQRADDGLALISCAITNAVRCVPPQNKPTPAEIASCRPFFTATLASMPRLTAMLALGRIAHDQVLRALKLKLADWPFAHGRRHDLPLGFSLFDSYHCSRYNTNTGVLTPQMFRAVFDDILDFMKIQAPAG